MNRAQFSAVLLLASCAFIAINVVSFVEFHGQRYELSSDDIQVNSDQVTVLGDKLSKHGVNTGDSWRIDESVPVGELNPSLPIFQAGSRSTSVNVTSKPSARPNEDKGEYYGDVLQRSGVNTGEANSQWNRRFANADGLEPSYSVGPVPNREKESFTGMVDDVLSGKENGGTVKKAVKKFDAALTQFLRVDAPSSRSHLRRRNHAYLRKGRPTPTQVSCLPNSYRAHS
jgi:hypothetical protein